MQNIIIFSPHPDDAETILGGFIIKHLKYKVLIVNLTRGECSSNGYPEAKI